MREKKNRGYHSNNKTIKHLSQIYLLNKYLIKILNQIHPTLNIYDLTLSVRWFELKEKKKQQ